MPGNLEPCHLAAAGGIAARVISWHEEITIWQTRITPIGLVTGPDGQVVNLRDHALDVAPSAPLPPVVLVAGTSMNAGKTRTASGLALGLVRQGQRVAAIKITGTGAGGDLWAMHDAGAAPILDFTDAGFASTHRLAPADLAQAARVLLGQAAASGASVIVEIADGLYQADSAAALRLPVVKEAVSGVLFAANDSMGAGAGIEWLRREGYRVLAVSGRLCLAPLLVREVETVLGMRVLRPEDLERAEVAATLVPGERVVAAE